MSNIPKMGHLTTPGCYVCLLLLIAPASPCFRSEGQFQGNAFGLQKVGRDPRPLPAEVIEGLAMEQ